MTIDQRPFGQTGLSVPPLIFGATSLGNLFRQIPDEEKADIISNWLQAPWNPIVIDSAGKYGAGLSLEVIGRELQRCGVPADRILISNKLAWRRVPLTTAEPTFEPGAWVGLQHDAVQDISREGILRCWEDGNALLGDYSANLVSVHDPDEYLDAASDSEDRQRRLEDILEAYDALLELKEQGKVAAVGVGAKDWRTVQEISQLRSLDWVMLANSFTVMSHPPELLDFLSWLGQHQVGVINSALYHGGFLLGGSFFDYRQLDEGNPQDQARLNWREAFNEICQRHQVSAFAVGLAFGRLHPSVTSVALSSSRADRVAGHVAAMDHTVPQPVWDDLRAQGLIANDLSFLS